MSNTDIATPAPRFCKECDAQLPNNYGVRCDKCTNRSNNSDQTHELALHEDTLRRLATTDGERWQRHAYASQQRAIAERDITDGSDARIENLWRKLWDALDGDVERDTTWDLFMSAIPGLPDYRVKTYAGVVTLKFYFSEVDIESDSFDIEQAICDAISGDLRYGYHDEMEVEYDEE
jgi:hypothetical protein